MSIDWGSIEGYREDMTAEEKLALLDNYEPPKPTPPEPTPEPKPDPKPSPAKGGVVSKAQFDKVSSELAALKKQIRSQMTEDEQKELDRQAKVTEMETELNDLRHEKKVVGIILILHDGHRATMKQWLKKPQTPWQMVTMTQYSL